MVTLNKGENFSLPCKCFGTPSDVEYRWVKGVEKTVLSNTSMLRLHNVQAEDSGTYKCLCKNVVMEMFQDVQIVVVCKFVFSIFSFINYIYNVYMRCQLNV